MKYSLFWHISKTEVECRDSLDISVKRVKVSQCVEEMGSQLNAMNQKLDTIIEYLNTPQGAETGLPGEITEKWGQFQHSKAWLDIRFISPALTPWQKLVNILAYTI